MTILFAYDGSDSADAAISAARGLLQAEDADAVVLTVWEPLTVQALRATAFGVPAPVPLDVADEDDESERDAKRLAERGAERAREAGFEARAVAVSDRDNIAEAIVSSAEELGVDLIVMGARGLAGVRAYLGSVSNHVLQHARRPVLVVPSMKDGD